jgi:hypothetical protein
MLAKVQQLETKRRELAAVRAQLAVDEALTKRGELYLTSGERLATARGSGNPSRIRPSNHLKPPLPVPCLALIHIPHVNTRQTRARARARSSRLVQPAFSRRRCRLAHSEAACDSRILGRQEVTHASCGETAHGASASQSVSISALRPPSLHRATRDNLLCCHVQT